MQEPYLLLCSSNNNNESSSQSLTNIASEHELHEYKCYSAPDLSRNSSSNENQNNLQVNRKSNFKEFANTSIKAAHIVASECQQKYFKN